ncbi:MAG: cellulose biosynthesis cyclic di-GMP-binding regulatory protein BcsB, partial [Methylococcales bacterium]
SGTTNEEVKNAVQSFALLNAQFPDTQQTVIHKALLTNPLALNPPKSIVPNSAYPFTHFNFKYQPLNAANSEVSLNIRMPPDLYGTEENVVEINLNMAYGAGMRKDSVINVNLNGLFDQAIQLKETGGAHFRNYQITIPLRKFSAGHNKITFSTVLTPSEYGQCAYVQRDNLLVSIYEDSTIAFHNVGRGTSLPDLQLLGKTSFPFIINGFADGTVFKVLDNSSDSIAAAWHLIAKLATNFETPVYDINITQGQGDTHKNVVLIGHLSPENESVLAGSPVKLGALSEYPYRFKEQQKKPEEPLLDWMDRVMDKRPLPMATTVKPNSIQVVQTGGLGERFLMVSYPSPDTKGKLMLALVNEKSHPLYTGMNTLLTSPLWSQLEGNIFSWNKQEQFHSQQEGDTFLTERGVSRHNMEQFFSKHPWKWVILIVSTLLFIAWLIHLFLIKRKKLHNPQVD